MKLLIVTKQKGLPMYEAGSKMTSIELEHGGYLAFKLIEAEAAFEITDE